MRILFLVCHGFFEHSGISKKIHYQVKGLKENGHDVRLCYYDFAANGHSCRFVDGKVIKDYGNCRGEERTALSLGQYRRTMATTI